MQRGPNENINNCEVFLYGDKNHDGMENWKWRDFSHLITQTFDAHKLTFLKPFHAFLHLKVTAFSHFNLSTWLRSNNNQFWSQFTLAHKSRFFNTSINSYIHLLPLRVSITFICILEKPISFDMITFCRFSELN